MRIGIGLPNQVRDVSGVVLPGWAAAAENAGFASLGTAGRLAYPGIMDTVALAAAAAVTSRIELLTNVLLGPVWPGALLAKELAGIDAVSGGRLTVGLGLGARPDDFVVNGLGVKGRVARLEADIETYRRIWRGEPVGSNPAVSHGAREIPLVLGGQASSTSERVARLGSGYVAGVVGAEQAGHRFENVRTAWKAAGREGDPRLIATAYFGLGDVGQARANVLDYYRALGAFAEFVEAGLADSADAVRTIVADYAGIGADDLIFIPATADIDEISRLAKIVF